MKNINIFILILVTSIFFTACGSEDSTAPTTTNTGNLADEEIKADNITEVESESTIPSKYYGTWSFVHSGEEINIISTTDLDITEVADDENLLKVNADNTTYFLIRSSLSNTTITGKVEIQEDSSTSKSPSKRATGNSGIGGMNIILSNVLDKNIQERTTTENDGSFTTKTLPTGIYNLEVEGDDKKLSTQVEIKNQENDIGTFKLTGDDLYNFKAELIINEDYIISDSTKYDAILRIKNISNNVGYGLNYDISLDKSEFVKSFSEESENALGSLTANSYKDIPISFAFDVLPTNMKEYGIDVIIKDALGNEWIDSFKFNVHRAKIAIEMATKTSVVKGYIKNPLTGEMLQINSADAKIIVPLMLEDNPYILVLSNPSFDEETAYSIGVNQNPSDFNGFENTADNEPNNSENNAVTIPVNSSIISYLHATDIDYWNIYTTEGIEILNVTPIAKAGDDKVVLEGASVTLNASSSTDSDGTISSYEWKEGTTTLSTNASFSKSDFSIGTHAITLRVTDDGGATATDSISITISEIPNVAPTADAGSDQIITFGDIVTLNASSSVDSDGTLSSYSWKEGTTTLSTSSSFLKSDFTTGTHTLTLTVIDNDGATDTDTLTLTVNAIDSGITHNGTTYKTVTSPYTNKVWLDRNLGASRVCTALDDTQCYGDYYQWGRDADGHEKVDSSTTSTQATNINSAGSSFITEIGTYNYDWAKNADSDGSLRAFNWSKTDGSSVCPVGYRVPTIDELKAETLDEGIDNNSDAFNNFLKLPSAGGRISNSGSMYGLGSSSSMSSSSVNGSYFSMLLFNSGALISNFVSRAGGLPVRCLRD